MTSTRLVFSEPIATPRRVNPFIALVVLSLMFCCAYVAEIRYYQHRIHSLELELTYCKSATEVKLIS